MLIDYMLTRYTQFYSNVLNICYWRKDINEVILLLEGLGHY